MANAVLSSVKPEEERPTPRPSPDPRASTGQLMHAVYRSGRTADALASYQAFRDLAFFASGLIQANLSVEAAEVVVG